jgi:sugar lactone lactonase YvrE
MLPTLCLVTAVAMSAAAAAEVSLGEPLGTVGGLMRPESVVVTPDGRYVISNINGDAAEKDGNGFLSVVGGGGGEPSRLYPTGDAPPLHAPKGICVAGKALAVTDIDRIAIIDRSGARFIPRSYGTLATPTFLNDVTYDGKEWLYASDTRLGRVLRFSLDGERVEEVATAVTGVNGLLWHKGKLLLGASGEHDLGEIDVAAAGGPTWFGLAEHFTMIDGIAALEDDTLIVTDPRAGAIYAVSPDRKAVTTLETDLPFPADIAVDPRRDLLLVPMLRGDTGVAYPIVRR